MGSFGELVNSDVRRDECERAGKPHTSMAYKGDILIDLPRAVSYTHLTLPTKA